MLLKDLKRKFSLTSIKFKLIGIFSLILLLVSLTLGVASFFISSSILTEEVELTLASMAQEGSKLIESRVETQMRTLEILARREDLTSMDWEIQQPVLERQIGFTDFLTIDVVDLDGIAHYINGTTLDLSTRGYIQRALRGESNVSDVLISAATNEAVMMYAAPLIDERGVVVGALIARSDATVLSQLSSDMGQVVMS